MKRTKRRFVGRKFGFECLEQRQLLSAVPPDITFLGEDGNSISIDPADYLSGFQALQSAVLPDVGAELEMYLTAAADPATRVTGLGFDGVVEVRLYPNSLDLTNYGTGTATLLPNGHDLLTAAHVFTTIAFQSAAAVFTTPTGTTLIFIPTVIVHPGWTGNLANSPDIAIANLATPAPADADRYDIFRNANEVNQNFDTVGYGRSGTGLQGEILPAGIKRDGDNRVDAFGQALNGTVFVPGTFSNGAHLVFDFDNGNAANDAGGFFLGLNNLGLGALEVNTARGDSGGPAFINGQIAGITSFGFGFNGFTDVRAGTDSSFGEFSVDTRVSPFAGWIDSVVDIIAPNAPSLPNLFDADDTGFFSTDNVTRLTTLRFSGTAEAGSTVELLEGGVVLGNAVATGGNWGPISVTVSSGVHNLVARARDAAGNVSANSAVLQVTVDTQGPIANIVNVSPDPRTSTVSSIDIQFTNETLPVDGFNIGDLRLVVNGSGDRISVTSANFSNSSIANYTLGNLTRATDSPGVYTLSFVAASGITDRAGNPIVSTDTDVWTQTLTYSGTNFMLRIGSAEITGTTTGAVTLAANATSITKTALGTAEVASVNDRSVPVQYFSDAGVTKFTTNVGAPSPLVANWSVYAQKPGASASTVEFAASQNLALLEIKAGAKAVIAENGNRVLSVGSLVIRPGGTLDMVNNDMIIRTTAANKDAMHGEVENWIIAGMNGLDANLVTNWNGTGIVSSFARTSNVATGFDLVSVGAIRNSDINVARGLPNAAWTSWGGQTVTADYVLVKYTYVGDGDLDGAVEFDDISAMDNAFYGVIPNVGWATGDINYDNTINFDDISKVDQANYNQGAPL